MHTSEQYVLPFHKGKSVCWNRYPPTLTSNFLFGLFSMVRAFQALANPKIKWLLNFQAIFWLFPKLSHSHSFWFRLIFQQHVLLAFFFGFTKKRIKSNKQQESQRIRVCWKSQKLQWFPRFFIWFCWTEYLPTPWQVQLFGPQGRWLDPKKTSRSLPRWAFRADRYKWRYKRGPI